MNYGFIVTFADSRNYLFRFYAVYSATKEQAKDEFRFSALERNYSKLKIVSIREATRFEWENYEVHGDVWHSPDASMRVAN